MHIWFAMRAPRGLRARHLAQNPEKSSISQAGYGILLGGMPENCCEKEVSWSEYCANYIIYLC